MTSSPIAAIGPESGSMSPSLIGSAAIAFVRPIAHKLHTMMDIENSLIIDFIFISFGFRVMS
jgi:hypothetical protein